MKRKKRPLEREKRGKRGKRSPKISFSGEREREKEREREPDLSERRMAAIN